MMRKNDAARQRRKVLLRHDDQRIDRNAHHDRRNAIEHIGSKAHRIGKHLAPAKLREIDSGGNSHRNSHEACKKKNDP